MRDSTKLYKLNYSMFTIERLSKVGTIQIQSKVQGPENAPEEFSGLSAQFGEL